MAGFGSFLTYLFFFTTGRRKKMKQILNTLTISDFITKCTNYIYITCQLFPTDNLLAADLSTG